MRYITMGGRFYAAWDAMVLLYTQYPTITPVVEEQIENDLIAYLDKYGYITYDLCSDDDRFTVVDPKITAHLILQDVKEVLQHDGYNKLRT